MPDNKLLPGFNLKALTEAAKAAAEGKNRPPVHLWTPELSGTMDMVIQSNGSWWHEGVRIVREPLVKLFASILKREGYSYFLVTPTEKWEITVERFPFVATHMDISGGGADRQIFFTTNLGEVTELSEDFPLNVTTDAATLEPEPRIRVRNNLEALISRSVFYELVDLAEDIMTDAGAQLCVKAGGQAYPLGPAGIHEEVFND